MTINVRICCMLILSLWILAISPSLSARAKVKMTNPDFTKGEKIPEGATHDWNLGATGARGWIFTERLVTKKARQIFITKVAKGSPASEQLNVGDVILGVEGKNFSYDPRTEIGKAISKAESKEKKGALSLIRWRKGSSKDVVITLEVLGDYSATAPYNCEKSKRIFEEGCQALAKRLTSSKYPKTQNPITRSLNALALLASGEKKYLELIKREAQWASSYSASRMQTWYYGYVIIFLSEYKHITGDTSVMPGLKRLVLESVKGQSRVGSWGHRFANSEGRLEGYGMMNAPTLPLVTGMAMARMAGVKNASLNRAIERSAKLYRFYIGKGAVPYGDHKAWIKSHEDNGKCGMASVMFNTLGESSGTKFFSNMSTAATGPSRDTGHTGNFFNILWSLPAISLSGPNATGEWMKEFGSWYFDLARKQDGSFIHLGAPEPTNDKYARWDCSGAYLLAYALPLKKLWLTGKKKSAIAEIDKITARNLIEDGRGWNSLERNQVYDKYNTTKLLKKLSSWSPIVRERAATALSRRKDNVVPELIKLLMSKRIESQYGACQALIALRGRSVKAVQALRDNLQSDDLWLRIKTAEALAKIGKPAMEALPELLELLTKVDKKKDPRAMQQRYLSGILFASRGGMLSRSLDGVDREMLYKAIRAGLQNEDGHARSSVSSVYRKLSAKDIKVLLPAIHGAVVEAAPSGIMFADGVRLEGLKVLSKHRVESGMKACVDYARTQNPWGSQKRIVQIMKILLSYGVHAKSFIPQLEKIAADFADGEDNFPKKLSKVKAVVVRDAIKAIQASKDKPKLQLINEK